MPNAVWVTPYMPDEAKYALPKETQKKLQRGLQKPHPQQQRTILLPSLNIAQCISP